MSLLGRNLKRTIIIDNVWENFQLQPQNAIYIKTWQNDDKDTCLIDLIEILKNIVYLNVSDVKPILIRIKDILIRQYLKGDKNCYKTLLKQLGLIKN